MKNTLFKDGSVYLLATLIQSGIQLLFIPYLTRALLIEEFAKAELFLTAYGLINIVLLFGINTQIYRDIASDNRLTQVKEFGLYRSKMYGYLLINSLIVFSALLIWYVVAGIGYKYIIYAALASSFYVIFVFELCVFQIKKKAFNFLHFNLVFTVCNILITVLALEYFKFEYEARFFGYLAPAVIFALFFSTKYKVDLTQFSFKEYKNKLVTSFPLFFSAIASWTTESIDKFMIAGMLKLEDVAIYSVGYKFGMIMLLLTSAYSRAWMPFVIDKIHKNEGIRRALFFSIVLMIVGCLCYLAVIPFVYRYIVPDNYHVGLTVVIIVSIAYTLDGITKLFNAIFISNGHHSIYVYTTIIAGFSNISFNYLLIPVYGYLGAGYATLLSFLLALISTVVFYFFKKNRI